MAMSLSKSVRSMTMNKDVIIMLSQRNFAAKAKKETKKDGKKGKGKDPDAPKESSLSKEVKSSTTVGAHILKEGTDPKTLPDSEYPDWLWHVLHKRPALSELKRAKTESLSFENLKRFVKLDTRARIKENNIVKAKN